MGAIKEVSAPADRAELFTPDLEMRRLIQRFLERRLQKQLDAGKSRLGGLKRALPDLEKSDAETLRLRIKQLHATEVILSLSGCNPGMRKPGRCCRSPGLS
jgi:hypothetical protein